MTRALLLGAAASAALAILSCRPRPQQHDPLGPNAGCYICHPTFIKEELTTAHLQANISCARCHGPSIAHANDEDIGATPPDLAFKRGQINTFCRTCHKSHDAPPERVIARWRERRPAKPPPQPLLPPVACTDCHGTHKIAKRAAQRESAVARKEPTVARAERGAQRTRASWAQRRTASIGSARPSLSPHPSKRRDRLPHPQPRMASTR